MMNIQMGLVTVSVRSGPPGYADTEERDTRFDGEPTDREINECVCAAIRVPNLRNYQVHLFQDGIHVPCVFR